MRIVVRKNCKVFLFSTLLPLSALMLTFWLHYPVGSLYPPGPLFQNFFFPNNTVTGGGVYLYVYSYIFIFVYLLYTLYILKFVYTLCRSWISCYKMIQIILPNFVNMVCFCSHSQNCVWLNCQRIFLFHI